MSIVSYFLVIIEEGKSLNQISLSLFIMMMGIQNAKGIDISVAVDNVEELEEQLASHDEQVTPHTDDFDESQENHEDCEPFDDPTLSAYYAKVQRKQKAWEDLRPEVLIRTFQFAGQNTKSACIICGRKIHRLGVWIAVIWNDVL